MAMSAVAESADEDGGSTDCEVVWWSGCRWYLTERAGELVRLERVRAVSATQQEGDAIWLLADAVDC